MKLLPMTDAHFGAAGELLASRHRSQRKRMPFLSQTLGDPVVAREAVAGLVAGEGARGLIAFEGDRPVAYLIGTARADLLRGRHVWVSPAGHATAKGADPQILCDLYAALADRWVREGYSAHFVMTFAHDRDVIDTWFGLSFGREQVHALMPLPASFDAGPSVRIRRATLDDLDRILEIGDGIARNLAASPVFGVYLPEQGPDHWRRVYGEYLADEAVRVWMIEEAGRVLAFQGFEPMTASTADPLLPEECIALSVAVTRPEYRGRGLARALAAHGLRDAVDRGFRSCATDWRSANLQSARLWPRLGFEPFLYRLHRRIDDRIVWAQGPNDFGERQERL